MSGLIPKTFINELLARTEIVDVIDAHVPLRKAGKNYVACCPFHEEKTPSFSVNPQKQFYHCFGCGKSGNALSFLLEYARLDFPEAVENLAARYGLSVPHEASTGKRPHQQAPDLYQLLAKLAEHYQQQLHTSQKVQDYLQQRGLSTTVIDRYQLGYAPAAWENLAQFYGAHQEHVANLCLTGMLIAKENHGYYARFRDRLMFPIHDRQQRIIGFGGRVLAQAEGPKYLNSPETPLFHKGSELYGLCQAIQHNQQPGYFLIVEGYLDLLTLVQYGFTHAVATLGTATTKQHLERLFRYSQTVIFCFDGDTAGKKAAWRALEIALTVMQDGYQSKFIFLPDKEDPDSFLRQHGAAAFEQAIKQAMPLETFFFSHLLSQVETSTLAGRAQLVQLAKPLLDQMPPGVFQQMMLSELAKHSRIDRALVKPTSTTTRTPSSSASPQRLTPIKLATALLLQHPQFIQYTEQNEDFSQLPYSSARLLTEIIAYIRQHPSMTTAALLEYARNQQYANYVNELISWEHLLPKDDCEQEFIGVLNRLRQMLKEQQIAALFSKAERESLSAQEKGLLQQLILTAKA